MAVSIKRVTLWRMEAQNRPGALAAALEPLARARADLKVIMGYRYPGEENRAAIEIYPISGKRATAAAQSAGLSASSIPTLMVEGPDRAGLGAAIAKALGDAGVNMGFVVTQVIGKRFTSVVGFESEADANRAAALIRKAVAAKRR